MLDKFEGLDALFYRLSFNFKKINLVLTESPRQGTSAGPFCSSTRRSKSRPVCLTNVGRSRPLSIGTRQFSGWSPASSLGIVAQPVLGIVAR